MSRTIAFGKLFVAFVVCVCIFSFVVPAGAEFSSIIITDVKPTELHPGDTVKVILRVENNGGRDAKDIRLAFQGTNVLSVVGPTVAQINSLDAWRWKYMEITVHVEEDAPNGVYSLPVTCSWYEYYFAPERGYVTTSKAVQLGISFNVIGSVIINIGDVITDPLDIRPGDENVEIRAIIENSGEAAAKDIEAKLLCNDMFKPSWSGTDRSYIGRLNSGEKGEAIFHIDIADNMEAKTYSIPLRIKYKDTKGKEYEVIQSIEILVEPKPEFKIVSFYTEPANISAGDKGVRLHIKVRNVGSEEAESVSIRITGEADVPFDYDVNSDYIGNLKVGEEGEALLKFDVDKDAVPKAYPQGIEIRCGGDRDLGDDNVYVFDKQIMMEVSSNAGRFSVPGFEGLFAASAPFVIFLLRRKRGR